MECDRMFTAVVVSRSFFSSYLNCHVRFSPAIGIATFVFPQLLELLELGEDGGELSLKVGTYTQRGSSFICKT